MKNIQLLQGYYRFLSLGKYLEFLIQSKDFSKDVLDIAIMTGKKSHFGIRSSLVKNLLKQIHEKPEQKNIFWYLVEISSFRGIFGIMRELLENNQNFKKFIQKKLDIEYFSFEQTIRLVRNVLSHTTTAEICIKRDDFIKQKDFLLHQKINNIKFDFLYAKNREEWKWKADYGVSVFIDFETLKEWTPLFDIIPLHNLYLLSELCYNLCEIFRVQTSTKKPRKRIWKIITKK